MTTAITVETVQAILARHLSIYQWRRPVYQATMLASLRAMWRPQDRRVLDVGGGTGVIAQAINDLFPVDRVVSVDVDNRFRASLTIETAVFDGRNLPFEAGAFDCVVFNNVLHHVDPAARAGLLAECRRVAPVGPIFIKDHLARGRLDRLRLYALDVIGNAPFHGMVQARYLAEADWRSLADAAGYRIDETKLATYRSGAMAGLFPNLLETAMRWSPLTT